MRNIFGILLLAIVAMPSVSQAYGVTDRQVTRLSDTVTMYTLEFEFGFLNADMWMPLSASKTIKGGNETASVILSTEQIKDGKYFVPMKESGTFTLLVLEQHEVGKSKGSVEVEKLPITLLKRGSTEKTVRVFSGDELKDFVVKR